MNPTVDFDLHDKCPSLRDAILWHARSSLVRRWSRLSPREKLFAVSLAVNDRLIDRAIATLAAIEERDSKIAYYLSMEYLIGKSLEDNLINLGLLEECQQALAGLGSDLNSLLELEEDAALGNGGLGRLAACFMDSVATMSLPVYGYGLNYEFGLFHQEIVDGQQVERPDSWRAKGSPWQVVRHDDAYEIPLFGRVEETVDSSGNFVSNWIDCETIHGVPVDMLVVGYKGSSVSALRLFTARASEGFDMEIFNEGDYLQAVEQKVYSETVSKVLYPSEQPESGPLLRLLQEYFLVACSLKDILKRFGRDDYSHLPDKAAIQMNDTHPALAVVELMRILVDERSMPWEEAWDITTRTLAYTNHTLLPEALERWPVELMGRLLPRHLQLIYEINRRFLEQVDQRWPGDRARKRRMSVIEEREEKQVRMAHLAIVGSHSVNGVAAVHSELVKTRLVPYFYELWPEKFNNKTNGVTPRRWMVVANPGLSGLIREAIGDDWITNLEELRKLEPMADDASFRERFLRVKRDNKTRLSDLAERSGENGIDLSSLVDTQVKRIHEYKRQMLNVLHVIYRYVRITEDGYEPNNARTFVFAGKAAPGYWTAKEIIRLIHAVGRLVDDHPLASALMKVLFVPDYGVSSAEKIIPATDLSEQISTAGYEASGTGNMKFAMNGALTIGTLDGANIEIAEEVGRENIFIFGKTVDEISTLNESGAHPRELYDGSDMLQRVMNVFLTDRLSPGEPERYRWVFDKLVDHRDPYHHLADLGAYIGAHHKAGELYDDRAEWARRAILNVARMGKFSSDRTIAEYARNIWGIQPIG